MSRRRTAVFARHVAGDARSKVRAFDAATRGRGFSLMPCREVPRAVTRASAAPGLHASALARVARRPCCSPFSAGGRRTGKPEGARAGMRARSLSAHGCAVSELRPTATHPRAAGPGAAMPGAFLFGDFLFRTAPQERRERRSRARRAEGRMPEAKRKSLARRDAGETRRHASRYARSNRARVAQQAPRTRDLRCPGDEETHSSWRRAIRLQRHDRPVDAGRSAGGVAEAP
jgi:hypothetical protein